MRTETRRTPADNQGHAGALRIAVSYDPSPSRGEYRWKWEVSEDGVRLIHDYAKSELFAWLDAKESAYLHQQMRRKYPERFPTG